ncbi:mandelate racemase, partial [Halobacteriales archaeon QH_6_64_20]
MAPTITEIETTEFTYPLENVTTTPIGTDVLYEPGRTHERRTYAIRVHTDAGITGEYVGGNPPAFAQVNTVAGYLVGENPLHRERHFSELKRALRKYDRMGIGPVDIALWDFAGKYYDAPIHELLGTYRERLPVYVSTY